MKKLYLPTLVFVLLTFFGACKKSQKSNSDQPTTTSTYQNPEWAVELIEAYEAFNDKKDVHAASLVFDASEKMPVKNWENYLVCAMVFADNGKLEKAHLALDRAIEYGLKDVGLLKSITELNPLKKTTEWDAVLSRTQQKNEAYLSKIQKPSLFKELEHLWSKDQQALSKYEQNIALLDSNATIKDYRKLFEPVKERWHTNKIKLDSIVALYGWPNNDLVGEDGAKIAWSIAQHHPDVFFKKKCLGLMKIEMAKGKISPNHYAELNDRIARETWQKQTYGASMGKEAPYPIENVAEVNKRRFELGLPEPIEVYALYHGISFNPPSEEEIEEKYRKAQSDYKEFERKINSKKIDSALVYLQKALKSHGDISNEQLFESAKKLATTQKENAQKLSLDILQVLIWREWEKRFAILDEPLFDPLMKRDEWKDIRESLKKNS